MIHPDLTSAPSKAKEYSIDFVSLYKKLAWGIVLVILAELSAAELLLDKRSVLPFYI